MSWSDKRPFSRREKTKTLQLAFSISFAKAIIDGSGLSDQHLVSPNKSIYCSADRLGEKPRFISCTKVSELI